MTEEKRLIEEAGPLSEALLKSADADRPSPAARRAAAAALGITAGAPIDASAATGTGATTTTSLIAKLGIATLVAGGVAVAIVGTNETPKTTPPPTPAPVVAPPTVEPEPTPTPEPEPEAEPAPVVEETPKVEAPTKARVERPKKKRSKLDEEVRLIDVARGAVERGAHSRALKTLGTYRARFASGMLREEADALHVTALAGAGKKDEARRAFEAFERRYPQSSHAARLRGLFE